MSIAMIETSRLSAASPLARADEARWEAVRRRDAAFDGKFFFAVRTTGVYCKPSCASRPAKRENVFVLREGRGGGAGGLSRLQALPARQARRARSARSRRCRQACEMIDAAEEAPKLADLAASAGFSPYHFHRILQGGHGSDAEGLRHGLIICAKRVRAPS